MTSVRIRDAWPGLALLSVLTASLWCTDAAAHEVPHEHHDASATSDVHQALPAEDTIKELITEFRRTGDDRFLDRAWERLEPLLRDGTNDPHLLIEAAAVAQSRHEFDLALSLVDQSLRIDANNDQAWLLSASIHLVRGNADQAAQACNQLHNVPLLVMITCDARVSIARGNTDEPLRRLTALLDSAAGATLDEDLRAWSLSVAGDAAVTIDSEQAIALYERSLRIAESSQVRAALVDVLLTENRLEDADIVLDAGTDALPLAIRRMIVAKRTGHGSAGREIAAADHEFRHWIEKGDWLHAREMARFYLDVVERPELAQRLARINLGLQREPEDLLLAHRTGGL